MPTEAPKRYGIFIDGSWSEPSSGRWFETLDPATGKPIGLIAEGDQWDVEAAVAAARRALEGKDWATMDPSQRGRILFRLGALLREHGDELARLECLDNGKPLKEAKGDVAYAAWTFEYFAGMADKVQGETIPVPGERFSYTRLEPLGVTAHVVPWNFPIALGARSIAPALAAGNTVVAKPSSLAPLTNLRMAEIGLQAGLPPGAYNVVTGPGETVGRALVSSPEVDGIAFTGSVESGKEVMRLAADGVTPVTLELGGKCPNIVLPDADLERALRGVLRGGFMNAGQMCWAGSRLLVNEGAHREFVGKLVERAKALKVGPGLDEATDMGPLVAEAQLQRVLGYVEGGISEGARLLTGGQRTGHGGFFLEPCIFDEVGPEMKIAQEEIFGPVITVHSFRDVHEAVEIANGGRFGLCAGLWTRRLDLAHTIANQLEVGMVSVNEYPVTFPQLPFGGFKESGLGFEQGLRAVYNYSRTKAVTINLRP
jgi:acyl-CoA reductase-like NAD-dependent aldehyde dehydrogenase